MRGLLAGIAVGLIVGATGTAAAGPLRDAFLQHGDRVFGVGGETGCTVLPHNRSRNGFVCRVGGDYRARYGVIINEREAAITRYTSFDRYRVIVHRSQSPISP